MFCWYSRKTRVIGELMFIKYKIDECFAMGVCSCRWDEFFYARMCFVGLLGLLGLVGLLLL